MTAFAAAVNAGDPEAFFAAVTDDATVSGDGTDRDLRAGAEREIFSSNGRPDPEDVSAGGRTLTATRTNSAWGSMRTRWVFTVLGARQPLRDRTRLTTGPLPGRRRPLRPGTFRSCPVTADCFGAAGGLAVPALAFAASVRGVGPAARGTRPAVAVTLAVCRHHRRVS
ncbi:hypothetical protein RKD42_008112 [Streptomyces ambofaciens]